ncbi:hypothetical protein HDE_00642 [Halotydeus destructor]|nr:hypothetical protein HDE_00642 [Halotydeus destructor]
MDTLKTFHFLGFAAKVLFYSSCLIGLTYQVVTILELFFSYQTTIEVKLRRPTIFELPVVSMCLDVKRLVREDWKADMGHVNVTTEALDAILANMTIREKETATLGYDELFHSKNSCVALSPNADDQNLHYQNCDIVTSPLIRYFKNYKCFSFFTENITVDATHSLAYLMMIVYIDAKHCDSMLTFMTQAKEDLMVYDEDNWLEMNTCSFNFHIIGFSRSKKVLLKHPYETNCSDWYTGGHRTRTGCFRTCLTDYYSRSKNLWPDRVPALPDTPLAHFAAGDDVTSAEDQETVTIERKCNDQCGSSEECAKVSIHAKEHFRQHRKSKLRPSRLTFYIQQGLEETHKHNPKLDWIECVCYIGSAISLWFGASLVTLADTRWLRKIKYGVRALRHQ